MTQTEITHKLSQIIIIDDDQSYREVLARSFTRLEVQSFAFACPSDAIESIKEYDNCTVLLDLKLENDSGLRWIKQIREASPNATIILLTGYASISTAVEAIKLGADDYLAKPTTAREILKHLTTKKAGETIDISVQPMSVERLEWEHIQKILLENNGNISATARALGMHRRTLQRKLAKKPVKR